MNDNELDALVAGANPLTSSQALALPLSGPELELCEVLMALPTETNPVPLAARRRRVFSLPRIALAGAAAAAVVIGTIAAIQPFGGATHPAWAAESIAVAEAAPRLLLSGSGWHVTRADEFSVEVGELTFKNSSGEEIELRWRPASELDSLKADRDASADKAARLTLTVLGTPATAFRYADSAEYTAIWLDGSNTVEARGGFANAEAFERAVASIKRVSVDAWLSAMPADAVTPSERAGVVDTMLQGLPLPPGFDAAALKASATTSDRYQLGAKVSGTVACGWFTSWETALDNGDSAAAQQAVTAMGTSHSWPVLREMVADGDYPKVLWQLADGMASNATVGKGSVREAYRSSLGCG